MSFPQDLLGKYVIHKLNKGGGKLPHMTLVDGVLPGQTSGALARIYEDINTTADRLEALGKRIDFTREEKVQTIPQLIGNFQKKARLPKIDAAPTNLAWPFSFLNYVCGAATTANLPPAGAVVSGPFTGCYYFKCTFRGVVIVAHVGTAHEPTDDLSIQAKRAWLAFARRDDVANIQGGQPTFPFDELEAVNDPQAGPPDVLGCISMTGAHVLAVTRIEGRRNSLNTDMLKIVLVKEMALSPFDPDNPPEAFRNLA